MMTKIDDDPRPPRRARGHLRHIRRQSAHRAQPLTPATACAPTRTTRADGAFAYPELRIDYDPDSAAAGSSSRAFARLNQPGIYASSIARPALFRAYLDRAARASRPRLSGRGLGRPLGRARSPIPTSSTAASSSSAALSTAELSRWFPSTELVHIGDEVADGVFDRGAARRRPLALFDGPRTDFSLARLRHYTGTPAEHFQHFVLFTNYVRYVDEFVRFAVDALRQPDSPFTAPVGARRDVRARRPGRRRGADRRRHRGGATRCRPII